MVKSAIKTLVLSILIFFSCSFLTILQQIHAPWNHLTESCKLEIGFPWVFYYQFTVDYPDPIAGWNGQYLCWDFGAAFLFSAALIWLTQRLKLGK